MLLLDTEHYCVSQNNMDYTIMTTLDLHTKKLTKLSMGQKVVVGIELLAHVGNGRNSNCSEACANVSQKKQIELDMIVVISIA